MMKEQQEVLNIYLSRENEILKYSGEELGKYVEKMATNKICVKICEKSYTESLKGNSICVGLFQDFDITSMGVENPELDDEVYIDISNGSGLIAGVNFRSVLLGVYRFLTEAGCMWVRPGKDGEFIPEKNIFDVSIKIREKASYRHRGICIEGANSYENIAEIIEWAPKAGFNSYFFQFREAYTFFERWYSHRNNPFKKPEPFNIDMARGFLKKAEKEIKKRGLLYHAVGHGWTCEPFGIPGLSWDKEEYDIGPEVEKYLAEVNGKRELWGGIPLNTNLCYSNPKVRNIIINDIADYLEKKPEVDILHFWLADGSNNQCECANCRKMIPSDFYVMMLNDLDELLTIRNINTKVVFLIYVDLLWAPETEKIKNPDRFILMFAPITRTYSVPFETEDDLPEPLPYKRNNLKFPSNVNENIALLKSWEKVFKGDSFDFDYHFMWDHYSDPGYFKIAELLSKDIKNLKKIGLNGYVSCQVQRAFFPTGLGMYVMGRTLWDSGLDFEKIAKKYFECAFGRDGKRCMEYMKGLSELFDPTYLRGEREIIDKDTAERFSGICTYVDEFKEIIESNINSKNPCHAASWKYLSYHADLCCLLAVTLEAKASGKPKKALALWKLVEKYAQEHEDQLQKVFDVFEFVLTLNRRINRK